VGRDGAFIKREPSPAQLTDYKQVNTLATLFNTEGWKGKHSVQLSDAKEMTLMISLLVLGVAGFGRTMSFASDGALPPGPCPLSHESKVPR
jgi:hypothetical protein